MKHPRKLKRRHKELLESKGLNPDNWHVERDTPKEVVFVHKISGKTRTFKKN